MSPDRDLSSTRDPFGLARLPELAPPGDPWPALAGRLDRRRHRRQRWPLLAAAAGLALALGLVSLLTTELEDQRAELERWISYSQALERQVGALARNAAALRGHEALALAALEDQVASLDAQLGAGGADDTSLSLWRERAGLMQELLAVHAQAEERRWDGSGDAPAPVVTRGYDHMPVMIPAQYIQ